MSKLDDLIQKLCSNGVEYKKLSEIFDTKNGYTPSKKNQEFWKNGTIPWFRMGDIRENGRILDKSLQYVSPEAVKRNLFPANSIIISTSATIGEHALITVDSLANQRFTYLILKDRYKDKYNIKFLYYFCFKLAEYSKQCLNQSNFASVDMNKFKMFEFPIPPLSVQEEIVRILDNFTELINELTEKLTSELTARKKQYEYYRDNLLKTAKATETYYLNQISENCDNQRKPVTSGNRISGEYPYYGASGIVDYVDDYIFYGDYLLISEDGANLLARNTPIAFSISGKNWVNNHAHVLHFNTYETRKYIEIYLNSIDLTPYITGGAQPKLNQKNLNKIPISLPPLEEQQRIVDILDRFDKFCNDITEGLPAEIEARQKQYEYYRDKLLTFKPLEEVR